MSKNWLCVKALLCALLIMTSCSKEDSKVDPLERCFTATYAGEAFDLSYSKAPMPGKSALFSTTDGLNGTLILKGAFPSETMIDPTSVISCSPVLPGVIPGEEETIIEGIPLTLEKQYYSFSGRDDKNGRTIIYSGTVNNNRMRLELETILPDNPLLHAWRMAPIIDGETSKEPNQAEPITFTWNASKLLSVDMSWFMPSLPEGIIMEMSCTYLCRYLGSSIFSPLFDELIRSLSFRQDGNITLNYYSSKEDQIKESPLNLLSYYINKNTLYLLFNAEMILKTIGGGNGTNNEAIIRIIKQVVPLMSEGIPFSFEASARYITITLEEQQLRQLIRLATSESILPLLFEIIPQKHHAMMNYFITQLPEVLETTTHIKLEFNLFIDN